MSKRLHNTVLSNKLCGGLGLGIGGSRRLEKPGTHPHPVDFLFTGEGVSVSGPMFLPEGSLSSGFMFRGSLSRGVSVWGICEGDLPDRDPPRCMVKSGRYTSYSNANKEWIW